MSHRFTLILILSFFSILPCVAQRKATPVENDEKKPPSPTLHYFDKHGKPLDEPVLSLATLDSTDNKNTSAPTIYPRFSELNVGINFFDGITAIAGSHCGGADIWASAGMWNRLFPTVEIGIGAADKQPEGNNYTYKGKPSLYAKIGADYNFLYKGNPDYQLLGGLRCGFSSFGFSLENISVSSDYWDESRQFSIDGQRSAAVYGEALLGLKVRLWKNFAMGWSVRYRFMLHNATVNVKEGDAQGPLPYGAELTPWYVPGFGPRTSHLGFTFSVVYTLPMYKAPKDSDISAD